MPLKKEVVDARARPSAAPGMTKESDRVPYFPLPLQTEGLRFDGGGLGRGWPLLCAHRKKGRPEGRPEVLGGNAQWAPRRAGNRDNAVHNIGAIPPGFKKESPILLKRMFCRRRLLLRRNIR